MFCPLASGSKGNAIFFGTKATRILIDVGISARALIKRLQEIDVEIDTIQAMLVTHEHTDHIAGVEKLAQKYKIPVFVNAETAKAICHIVDVRPKFKIFATDEPFSFGDLTITPFSVSHDAVDPVGFAIQTGSVKVGFCTDLGFVSAPTKKKLSQCNYLYVEANHQPDLVHACNRPDVYKRRVLGRQGHLSNEQCAELLKELVHSRLEHVHLAHLSSECNRPDLALSAAQEALPGVDCSIAHQDRVSKQIVF